MLLIEGIDGDEPKIKQRTKMRITTTIYENIFMLAQDYGMYECCRYAILFNQTVYQGKNGLCNIKNFADNVT